MRLASNAPCRIVNSPMKPFSSGRPAELSIAMAKTIAYLRHHVRQAAVLRDLARVAALVNHADIRKSMPVEMP